MHAQAVFLVLMGGLLAAGEPTPAPASTPAATAPATAPATSAPASTPAATPAPKTEPATKTEAAPATPESPAPTPGAEAAPEGDEAPATDAPSAEAPVVEEAPVVLPTVVGDEIYLPPLPADLTRRYRKLRLVVEEMPGGRYIVRDGQGYSLDAHTFAELTNDAVALETLRAGRKKGKRDAIIIASVGGAMALSATLPLLFLTDNDRPDPEDYLLDPDNFPDDSSYLSAQAQSDAQYALALGVFNSAEGTNEDLRWTSLALVTGGSMLLFVSPTPYELSIHQQKPIYLTYTRDEAEARVAAYNRAIRARLGMPEPQPPVHDEPAVEPVVAPSGTKLIIQPWIGPGMLGVQGRF